MKNGNSIFEKDLIKKLDLERSCPGLKWILYFNSKKVCKTTVTGKQSTKIENFLEEYADCFDISTVNSYVAKTHIL